MRSIRTIAFAAAAAATVTSGFAQSAQSAPAKPLPPGIHEIAWAADGQAQLATEVAPGKFAEWCGKLPRGAKVEWSFEAAGAMDFNVHYHAGKDVHYPEKRAAAASAQGTLEAPVDQDYCWMWTNKAQAPVALKASARRRP